MPVEYVKDSRGRYVPKGSLGAGQAVVPERPPAPRAKAKPAKPKPQGFQVWGMGAGGFSPQKLLNDLKYELKSGRAAAAMNPTGSLAAMPARQAILGTTTAATNATRNIIEMRQKAGGRPKGDYTTSPAGRVVDKLEGKVFTALGEKDPAQMTPQEKAARDLRSSLTLAVGAGLATGPVLGAAAGVRFIGPAAQVLNNAINVSKATTPLGVVGRLAADTIVGELLTTPFDDNTTGSVAGLFGAERDPVKPGMDRVEAASAAFLPNLAAGGVLGGALVSAPRLIDLFGGITRARKAKATVKPVETARTDLEGAGMTQSNPETSAAAFTPDATDPRSPLAQANAQLEEKYGITPAKAPEPEPAPAPAPTAEGAAPAPSSAMPDPWEVDYDPALPEADVALSFIRNSSDAELLESVRSGGPVLDALDAQVAARAPGGPDPAVSVDLSSAPSQNLATPVTPFADQWKRIGQKDPQQLLSVIHPEVNPELAARAKTMFGREWEELTVDDAVETLKAAAADGTTVIPNRLLRDQRIMRPGEIKVDAKRFQYKGGVDAQGVQKDGSLEGVDQWNNDMENVIEVWQDPADGIYYVVNGHNRLKLANKLGIKSLVVKEIIADNAEQAKTVGALSNIASGGGKPIDAARFMKGAGVKDPAQLEAMGVPLSADSGHGLSGFQLSQLPEDVLQAVESGQLKERMGRIIGGSGADEESMRGAYRYLVENPGTTEGRMKGMLELSKQMDGGPAKAARAEQTDLLKGTDWDQTFNKEMIAVADLADEVSTLLKREKKLFAMADSNSAALEAGGSRIDKASAQQIADANARAIDYFQRTWMETGPIRDLLNEGGTRVAGGENKGAIAKQIKNRLVGQLGDLMGEQAVVRADVVQEDLLAQAPQQLDELLGEDRQAMEMLAIQRAIQNGEVRPPETPIPELPADSGVDLLKVEREIADNTITDDAVKAMDDELRLRDEFRELDDNIARETEKAARDEVGYSLMTFDEKKKAGMLEGVEEPAPMRAAAVEIPASASRSITAKTSESRIKGAAESLMGWTSSGVPGDRAPFRTLQQAVDAVRSKGAILDPDAIPGLDAAVARNDKSMGRSTPATEAVADAYRQFYGVDGVDASYESALPAGKTPFDMSQAELESEALKIIRQTVGDVPTVRFMAEYEIEVRAKEWGGDGKKKSNRLGFYRAYDDLIQVNGMAKKGVGFSGLVPMQIGVAAHEPFHRLQRTSMGVKEAAVMNTRFAKTKIQAAMELLAGGAVKMSYSEGMTTAYQIYREAKYAQEDPVKALMGAFREGSPDGIAEVAWLTSKFDIIFDFVEKMYNVIVNGTFQSTKSIFERAAVGDLGLDVSAWEGVNGNVRRKTGWWYMDASAKQGGWKKTDLYGKPLGDESQGPDPAFGVSGGSLVDELNSAIGDIDPKTGFPRGVSKAAAKAALQGNPSKALAEATQLAEVRLSDINARIDAVKQRAALEGC